MNINRFVAMLTRIVSGKLLNWGLNKGIRKMNSDASGRQSPQQRSREKQARQAVKRARDAGIIVQDPDDRDETGRIIFQDKVGDRAYLNEQDQWGATLSLQYRPSANFDLAFDAMLGGYDTTEDEYDLAAYSASSRSTFATIHEYDATTLADHGIVVLRDVSYTATQHEFLSKERINETDFRQYSAALDWRGEKLTAVTPCSCGWSIRVFSTYVWWCASHAHSFSDSSLV